jgi:hypothetical protein
MHIITRHKHPEVFSKVCHDSFCQLENSVSLPWLIKDVINPTTCTYNIDVRALTITMFQLWYNTAWKPAYLPPSCAIRLLANASHPCRWIIRGLSLPARNTAWNVHQPLLWGIWPLIMASIPDHAYHRVTYGAGHLQLRRTSIIEIRSILSDTLFKRHTTTGYIFRCNRTNNRHHYYIYFKSQVRVQHAISTLVKSHLYAPNGFYVLKPMSHVKNTTFWKLRLLCWKHEPCLIGM